MEKTLKQEYLESAENYSKAMRLIFEDVVTGKEYNAASRAEKKSAKKCYDIFIKLKAEHALGELEEFMFHDSPYVRYLAAADSLYSNPELAEKTLETLIETKSGVGAHALTTLKAWRNIPWTEDRYK